MGIVISFFKFWDQKPIPKTSGKPCRLPVDALHGELNDVFKNQIVFIYFNYASW